MAVKRTITKSVGFDFIPLGMAFQEFIQEKEFKNLSKATIDNYKISFELFVSFNELDLEMNPNEITPPLFYKWMNTLKLEGKKVASINHYLRDCRTFFYWCMDLDRKYITTPFKIPMMEGQDDGLKMFSDEEIEALLVKPPRNDKFVNWRTWAIVNWVLATGNRAATICEVRLGDIDYTNKEIKLRHAKNKKFQIIPLSSSLQTVLKEYVRMWRMIKDEEGNPTTPEDFLFSDISQKQMTTNALKLSFSRYCESRGVERTNIHGLRHNFAKMWITNNGSMAKLQNILGHCSMEMTRRYVKLFGIDLKDDFDKFSPLDNIKRNSKRTQSVMKN